MMQNFIYPRTIRGIIVALMDAFNDVVCYNFDSISGTPDNAVARIPVPLKFGPKTKKYMSRLEEESNQQYYTQLPEMTIELKSIQYSSSRTVGSNEYRYFTSVGASFRELGDFKEDTQPTCYDFDFDLKIRTDSIDHTFQIFEQILPIFNPTITLKVKEFSDLNIEREFKVRMGNIPVDILDPMTEDDRREINTSIPITVEAVLYKPTSNSKIIHQIIYNQNILYTSESKLVTTYRTSGYDAHSVSSAPPDSHYNTSAYNPISNVYTFTSAVGYF